MDPAAGCGNFLVVSYRELRRLEKYLMSKLAVLAKTDPGRFNRKYPRVFGQQLAVGVLTKMSVNQFYGIEIDEWPAEIAKVAMWLTDHLANMELETEFGGHQARLPLTDSANITIGNALHIDWDDVLPAAECSYLYSNPPFLGRSQRDRDQNADMKAIWGATRGAGNIDYVTCWFKKAADYLDGHPGQAALVSTNSISQGEQPAILWGYLHGKGYSIDFAHRSFNWTNEARGKAAVHVVIIGFSQARGEPKRPLWTYPDVKSAGVLTLVENINAYLAAGPDLLVSSRRSPLVPGVPVMRFGSMPHDGGHLLLSSDEAAAVRDTDPAGAKYLRRVIGAAELLQSKDRYCLWLTGADVTDVRHSPTIRARAQAVREVRLVSPDRSAVVAADTPTLFKCDRQPKSHYLAVPGHSSEHRSYVPMALCPPDVIATNALLTIDGADNATFGMLSSRPFNIWLRAVSGRLKSDYRISAELTYNNFPWPVLDEAKKQKVSTSAQAVLDARANHPDASLADLYDPLTMPADLVKAHKALDRVTLGLYGLKTGDDDAKVLAALFTRYEELLLSQ